MTTQHVHTARYSPLVRKRGLLRQTTWRETSKLNHDDMTTACGSQGLSVSVCVKADTTRKNQQPCQFVWDKQNLSRHDFFANMPLVQKKLVHQILRHMRTANSVVRTHERTNNVKRIQCILVNNSVRMTAPHKYTFGKWMVEDTRGTSTQTT